MHAVNENMVDAPTVIAIKSVRVSDFGGRTLSTLASSDIDVNPDIEDAHQLRAWYEKGGKNMKAESMTTSQTKRDAGPPKVIAQIAAENLGMDKPDYFPLRGYITAVRHDQRDPWYPACPSEGCNNRKVVQESDGMFACEHCNQRMQKPNYRYILSFCMSDFSGKQWLTAFNESAEQMLGANANDVQSLKETSLDEYNAIFRKVLLRPLTLKARAKSEDYNGETRVKVTVADYRPFDFRTECQRLIQEIETL
mmetsp:Transcript_17388/g.43308  ORF Transcript_17388/g.43308 Transcript_17388/m.43308 type:complete len:252 (-) Transcript_17388:359-1114(-)